MDELLSSNWLRGPQFPWEKEILPSEKEIVELPIGDPEVRKVQALNANATEHESLSDRLNRFSSWTHAVSAVARLRRRLLNDKTNVHSTVTESHINAVRSSGYWIPGLSQAVSSFVSVCFVTS